MRRRDINVLIVEDDETVRKSVSALVKRMGFNAVEAASADEAEKSAKISQMHAAIVDCMLPKKNGIDLVKGLRDGALGESPVVMMSGVFKDETFAQDTKKKTRAIAFLNKPLDVEFLKNTLDENLSQLVDAPKVALHSLLSKPFANSRDRRKAIDHVEEISGYDLPLIFSILMDAGSSGHLNLVSPDAEIYGSTFAKGKISRVDSEDTPKFLKKLLLDRGFVAQQDVAEFGEDPPPNFLKLIVAKSLVSPHAMALIKAEQIMMELRNLIKCESLQVNFVPDRTIPEDPTAVSLEELTPYLHQVLDQSTPVEWLKEFYKEWQGHPILPGPKFAEIDHYKTLSIIYKADCAIESLKDQPTFDDVKSRCQLDDEILFKAIHLLAMRRFIVFDETKRTYQPEEDKKRLESILIHIKGQNAFDVFKYFGAGDKAKPSVVSATYKEFVKSNHPDKLPSSANEEIRKLATEVFSIVSNAHDILTDELKRNHLVYTLDQQTAEVQLEAEDIVEKAVVALRRAKYKQALEGLEKAQTMYPKDSTLLYIFWAKFKLLGKKLDPQTINDMEAGLATIDPEIKRGALYQLVLGLLKKNNNDLQGAFNAFRKALQLDPEFIDARREINDLKRASSKKGESVFTADLGSLIGNLFKKKG